MSSAIVACPPFVICRSGSESGNPHPLAYIGLVAESEEKICPIHKCCLHKFSDETTACLHCVETEMYGLGKTDYFGSFEKAIYWQISNGVDGATNVHRTLRGLINAAARCAHQTPEQCLVRLVVLAAHRHNVPRTEIVTELAGGKIRLLIPISI